MEGQSEDASDWRDGHPVVFPTILAVGSGGGLWKSYAFQIRVPMDDETTDHYWYNAFIPPSGRHRARSTCSTTARPTTRRSAAPTASTCSSTSTRRTCTRGRRRGASRCATRRRSGRPTRGVIMFRKMLQRELKKIEAGEDPICVVRDPAQNVRIDLPLETGKDMLSDGFESLVRRNIVGLSPIGEEVIDVWRRSRRTPAAV